MEVEYCELVMLHECVGGIQSDVRSKRLDNPSHICRDHFKVWKNTKVQEVLGHFQRTTDVPLSKKLHP